MLTTKLRSLQISGPLEPDVFFPNFNLFLKSAANLRDFRYSSYNCFSHLSYAGLTFLKLSTRFGLDFRGTESLLLFLKSLLRCAPDLERLFLFNFQPELQKNACKNPSELADFMVPLKMKRLVALCIVSSLIGEKVMQDVRSL